MQGFMSYETARLQMKNVSFVRKLQDFYLAKCPCLPLLPSDMQLWYQAAHSPAVCVPPFTPHRVRARSRSVWFRYFFSRTGMAQCCHTAVTWLWLLHHLTRASLSSSPRWPVLNSCSAWCHVREAVKFLSLHADVWWHMVNAWCPHWWLFSKNLQTKVRVIILTKS